MVFADVTSGRGRSLTGIRLTALVYEELAKYASKEFSAAELMQAAQQLIKLSKEEYRYKLEPEYTGRTPYYALNTFIALKDCPWRVICNEDYYMRSCDYPDYFPESLVKFQSINQANDGVINLR